MSTNSKLRILAEKLPYFPRIDAKNNLVVTQFRVKGSELLKDDAHAKDDEGNPIIADHFYLRNMVPCADHFTNMQVAYKKNGEQGVREYCDKVWEYHKQKQANKSKTEIDSSSKPKS